MTTGEPQDPGSSKKRAKASSDGLEFGGVVHPERGDLELPVSRESLPEYGGLPTFKADPDIQLVRVSASAGKNKHVDFHGTERSLKILFALGAILATALVFVNAGVAAGAILAGLCMVLLLWYEWSNRRRRRKN